jgi:hypothetical protein
VKRFTGKDGAFLRSQLDISFRENCAGTIYDYRFNERTRYATSPILFDDHEYMSSASDMMTKECAIIDMNLFSATL